MIKHLRNLIEELEKLQETHENADVRKELYGYKEDIPKYRTILGEIVVDGIKGNGKIVKDYVLKRPTDFPNTLYFDNFRTLHLYNGLYNFEEQFDSMMRHDFIEVEISMLNSIVKGDITIIRGYLKFPNKDFIEMLNSIEKAMFGSEK